MDEDFHTLTKIVPYAFSLNKEYTVSENSHSIAKQCCNCSFMHTYIHAHTRSIHQKGVTLSNVQTDIRVLQRQLNTKRKQLESCEPGRLDLVTASK